MKYEQKEFEKIVRDNEQTIYSICYMYSQNQEDTKDLVQEVLVNLWNGLLRFRGDSSLRTWVTRVTINTCLSFKRKKKLPVTKDFLAPGLTEISSEDSSQITFLHNRLKQLDYLDRALVMLWLEDLSYEEIGLIVGISAKNVGVRLVRIKNKLKNIKGDE